MVHAFFCHNVFLFGQVSIMYFILLFAFPCIICFFLSMRIICFFCQSINNRKSPTTLTQSQDINMRVLQQCTCLVQNISNIRNPKPTNQRNNIPYTKKTLIALRTLFFFISSGSVHAQQQFMIHNHHTVHLSRVVLCYRALRSISDQSSVA